MSQSGEGFMVQGGEGISEVGWHDANEVGRGCLWGSVGKGLWYGGSL